MARQVKITDRQARSLKAKDSRYDVGFGDGFTMRVFPNGRMQGRYIYQHEGKRRVLLLGDYGRKPGEETLSQLLAKHAQAKSQRKLSKIDPAAVRDEAARQKKLQTRAVETALTVGKLVELYLNEYAKPNKKSWKKDEQLLSREISPLFGSLKAAELTRAELRSVLKAIASKTPVQANRVLAVVRGMYNWAMDEELVETNPAARMKRPGGTEEGKDRALDSDEIKRFWTSLDKTISNELHRIAMKLILLTGQRPGEVTRAAWAEIDTDGGVWIIPKERTKNGKADHRVPLTDMVLAELDRLKEISGTTEWLFPQAGGKKPLYDSTLPASLRKALAAGSEKEKHPLHGMLRFTPHDLRRTCATQLGELDFLDEEISLLLNHSRAGITARYNRAQYDPKKLSMLEAWGYKLTRMLTEKKAENVLLLKRKRT